MDGADATADGAAVDAKVAAEPARTEPIALNAMIAGMRMVRLIRMCASPLLAVPGSNVRPT